MKVIPTELPEVLIIEPKVFGDERGFFFESFNERAFAQATGIAAKFVQDNHSRSAKNVVRGLHYQIQQPQGKLVRVVAGEVFDVAVDLRKSSPTFGKWGGVDSVGGEQAHAVDTRRVCATAFWCCRITPSFSTRPPITGRRIRALHPGTTPTWAFAGRSAASRCCRKRIGRASHSRMPRCLSDATHSTGR